MSRKKFDSRAIIMSLFGLVAVILIMVQMQNLLPKPPAEMSQLGNERIGIVDSVYINLPFHFMVKMPNHFWRLQHISRDTILTPLGDNVDVLDQMKWLVRASREVAFIRDTTLAALPQNFDGSIALVQYGVFSNSFSSTATDMALNLLAEIIAKDETGGGRVRILQPVTSPAHSVLKGAYFAVVVPENTLLSMPVQILAILPRGDQFYCIKISTTEIAYPQLREEFEELVQRFNPLPSAVR